MKALIDSTTYTALRNVEFAPEVDFTSLTMPVNVCRFEVETSDSIRTGKMCRLLDDMDTLYAYYRITLVEDLGRGIKRVTAQSRLYALDMYEMMAVYYDSSTAENAIRSLLMGARIIAGVGWADFRLDDSLKNKTIKGYAPRQTARERLQWILLSIGGHVEDAFDDMIEIIPLDETQNEIDMGVTFWRPSADYRDVVTGIKARQYTFTQGEPQSGDEYVEVNGVKYIKTYQDVSLSNPAASMQTDPINDVTVQSVTLIHSGNVDDILTLLSKRYFNRKEILLDCINNGTYKPGMAVTGCADEESLVAGYMESAMFTFGQQARSRVRIVGASDIDAARLTVIFKAGATQLGKRRYLLPVNTPYSIQNPYLDWHMVRHVYVYRPTTARVTGTLPEGGETKTVQYAVALDNFQEKKRRIQDAVMAQIMQRRLYAGDILAGRPIMEYNTLRVVSVDEVEVAQVETSGTTINVAVIS